MDSDSEKPPESPKVEEAAVDEAPENDPSDKDDTENNEGGVDPLLLASKLEQLQEESEKEEALDEQPTQKVVTSQSEDHAFEEDEEEIEGEEEEEEEKEEEKKVIDILIEQSKWHIDDVTDQEKVEDIDVKEDKIIIYGNVQIHIPDYKILLKDHAKEDFQSTLLKKFCMKTVSELDLSPRLGMDVESLWWTSNFGCGKCPTKFNCTCGLNIGVIVEKLLNFFDVVVIPDNKCTMCLRILEVLSERKLQICRINLELQDDSIIKDLKTFLEENSESSLMSQLVHHWSHDGTCTKITQINILGKSIPLPKIEYFDVAVFGNNSAAIALCQESESLGLSVCIVEKEQEENSLLWGFEKASPSYCQELKRIMLEAASVSTAIKQAPFHGIQNTEEITFDWEMFRRSATKMLNFWAWNKRISISNIQVIQIVGAPKIVNRNAIQVSTRNGDHMIRAVNMILAFENRLVYEPFPGIDKHCIKIHDLLSFCITDKGKTILYGSSIDLLEFAGAFNNLRFDVTVMINGALPTKYDLGVMKNLKSYMIRSGIKFVEDCKMHAVLTVPRSSFGAPSIPKVEQKYMVIGQLIKTGNYWRDYFDNVIIIPSEDSSVDDSFDLRKAGVKFSKYNKRLIEVDANLKTSVSNIYALGSFVSGMQDSTKILDGVGRKLVQGIAKGKSTDLHVDTKFHVLYTPVEYSYYGINEEFARNTYADVIVYHGVYTSLSRTLSDLKTCPPSYVKLICKRENVNELNARELIIGLHILGRNAGKIVQGFALPLSEGMTKEQLDDLLPVDFTDAMNLSSITVVKEKEDEPLTMKVVCETCM